MPSSVWWPGRNPADSKGWDNETQHAYLNERWREHKADLKPKYKPKTGREHCEGRHGGDWDKWEWRGDSFREEKAHCSDCGKQYPGILSPWHVAAMDDWKAHVATRDMMGEADALAYARELKAGKAGRIKRHPYGSQTWFGR